MLRQLSSVQALLALLATCSTSLTLASQHDTHNPLEKVNVLGMTHDLDGNIQLYLNSTVLAAGNSYQWFELSWQGVRQPSYADWIGLIVPAGADITQTAPAKYQIAAIDKNHVLKGEGRISFRLINYRSPMQFGFFRGGLMRPVLAARSPVITIQNPNEPLQRHLALTGDNTQMLVQWVTSSTRHPVVKWGTGPGKYTLTTRAASTTYTREELCGPPATSIGWVEPGLFHSALLEGLVPGHTYYYVVGDEEWGFSPEASFRAAPPVGPSTRVKVLAVADLGQGEVDGSMEQSEMIPSINTTNRMYDDMRQRGYELLVHNGDISYARGYVTQWDNFMHQLEPLVSHIPYMTVPGNHERDWPNSGDRFIAAYDSGGECGVALERRMLMPLPGPDKPWYSFDYGPIHFLQYSTEHAFHQGSEQHSWVLADLASVDRSLTPWLVVGGHRPMYISSSNTMPDEGDQPVAAALREAFEDAFVKYKVDVTLHGHHHSYQRTCPLIKGLCVGPDSLGAASGPVHLVIGNAGFRIDPPGFFQPPIWKVDLTLHGHHHSYQRTCPVIDNKCQDEEHATSSASSSSGATTTSSSSRRQGRRRVMHSAPAPVHLVIGNAGAELSLNIELQPTHVWETIKLWWGYLRIDASGTEMKCEAISDMDGRVMDSFTLTKPEGWGTAYMEERAAAAQQQDQEQSKEQSTQQRSRKQQQDCPGHQHCPEDPGRVAAE